MSARRLGHSVVVAEKNNISAHSGISAEPQTLEQAIGVEGLAGKIVRTVTGAVSDTAIEKCA